MIPALESVPEYDNYSYKSPTSNTSPAKTAVVPDINQQFSSVLDYGTIDDIIPFMVMIGPKPEVYIIY